MREVPYRWDLNGSWNKFSSSPQGLDMDSEGYIYVSDFTNASILGTSDNLKGFDSELSSSEEKPGGMIAKYKLTDQNAIDIVDDDEDESEVHDGEGVGGGGGCNMGSFFPLSGLILLPVFILLRK